jgi:hypothetical protein
MFEPNGQACNETGRQKEDNNSVWPYINAAPVNIQF